MQCLTFFYMFHFQKESGIAEVPDRITPNIAVDDKVIKPILQSLYFELIA